MDPKTTDVDKVNVENSDDEYHRKDLESEAQRILHSLKESTFYQEALGELKARSRGEDESAMRNLASVVLREKKSDLANIVSDHIKTRETTVISSNDKVSTSRQADMSFLENLYNEKWEAAETRRLRAITIVEQRKEAPIPRTVELESKLDERLDDMEEEYKEVEKKLSFLLKSGGPGSRRGDGYDDDTDESESRAYNPLLTTTPYEPDSLDFHDHLYYLDACAPVRSMFSALSDCSHVWETVQLVLGQKDARKRGFKAFPTWFPRRQQRWCSKSDDTETPDLLCVSSQEDLEFHQKLLHENPLEEVWVSTLQRSTTTQASIPASERALIYLQTFKRKSQTQSSSTFSERIQTDNTVAMPWDTCILAEVVLVNHNLTFFVFEEAVRDTIRAISVDRSPFFGMSYWVAPLAFLFGAAGGGSREEAGGRETEERTTSTTTTSTLLGTTEGMFETACGMHDLVWAPLVRGISSSTTTRESPTFEFRSPNLFSILRCTWSLILHCSSTSIQAVQLCLEGKVNPLKLLLPMIVTGFSSIFSSKPKVLFQLWDTIVVKQQQGGNEPCLTFAFMAAELFIGASSRIADVAQLSLRKKNDHTEDRIRMALTTAIAERVAARDVTECSVFFSSLLHRLNCAAPPPPPPAPPKPLEL